MMNPEQTHLRIFSPLVNSLERNFTITASKRLCDELVANSSSDAPGPRVGISFLLRRAIKVGDTATLIGSQKALKVFVRNIRKGTDIEVVSLEGDAYLIAPGGPSCPDDVYVPSYGGGGRWGIERNGAVVYDDDFSEKEAIAMAAMMNDGLGCDGWSESVDKSADLLEDRLLEYQRNNPVMTRG